MNVYTTVNTATDNGSCEGNDNVYTIDGVMIMSRKADNGVLSVNEDLEAEEEEPNIGLGWKIVKAKPDRFHTQITKLLYHLR